MTTKTKTTQRMTVDMQLIQLKSTLRRLRLEAINYRNTGKGVQFLNDALEQAERVLTRLDGKRPEALLGDKI